MAVKFEIGLHTVIILVGPSQAGKSTWSKAFQKNIKGIDASFRCPIVSSDEIRREIIGENLNRYDKRMSAVSGQAFDLLKERLISHITYPVNNEFVIIDTTGMDSQFRLDISKMAREHAYNVAVVIFDFPTSEYFKGVESGRDMEVVSKSVNLFKKSVMQTIKRKNFDYSFSVKEKSNKFFDDLEVNITEFELWNNCIVDSTREVVFIGDIHEHVEALNAIRVKLPQNAQVVLVGDYLDKGNNTAEIIPVIEDMLACGAKIIIGNHESYVARRLLGKIEYTDKENELFTSLSVLMKDVDLARRFLAIYEQSIPFVKYENENVEAYATHAPCQNKFLGKMSESAKKAQRNFYFKGRSIPEMAKELSFVHEENKDSHPLHIFGHVAHNIEQIEDKNKIWLDTGAVYGGSLSAFVLKPNGDTNVITVACLPLTEGQLFNFKIDELVSKEEVIEKKTSEFKAPIKTRVEELAEKYRLTDNDIYWLNDFIKSGASFISGTMSPSKSTETKLEPIEEALLYYKSKGIGSVSIQPKFMGSRVQMYLHKDSTMDFLITRSGHKRNSSIEMKNLMNYWSEKTKMVYSWKEQIILDGELMPWGAIGQDLINKEFIPYGNAYLNEHQILLEDSVFNGFSKFAKRNTAWHIEHINTFNNQVNLYGKVMEPYYVPFNILRIDGKVYPLGSHSVFTTLNNNQPFDLIDLNDVGALEKAMCFFDKLTNKEDAFEGVVIKPFEDMELVNCVPYMKVRNENYLHIIYGYDYQKKYAKMCAQKRIGKKLMLSEKEFKIGKKMLSVTKDELAELACQMLFELKEEETIDTRL